MREGESNLVSIGSPVVTYVTNGSNVTAVPNGENIPVGQYQGVPPTRCHLQDDSEYDYKRLLHLFGTLGPHNYQIK